MDELQIKGKKYISSKRAAELTGYAKDYVGQLIRSKKIDGVRFGRAWFVDEAEILAHAGIKSEVKEEKFEAAPPGTPLGRFDRTNLPENFYKPARFPTTWSQIKYFEDESDLLPVLYEKKEITEAESRVPVTVVEAKPIIKREVRQVVIKNPSQERIQVLVDGIKPKTAVIRVGTPNLEQTKAPKVRKSQRRGSFRALPVTLVAAGALLLFIFGFSGLFFSSQSVYISENQIYTSNVLFSIDHLIDSVKNSDFIQNGVSSISSFFGIIASSFSEFLKKGFDFVNIF